MKEKQKNILIVDTSPGMTGAFKSIFNYCLTLKEYFQFFFLIPVSSKLDKELEVHSFEYFKIKFPLIEKSYRLIWYLPELIIKSISTLKLIKDRNIEVVHINDLYNLLGIILKIINPKIYLIYHVRLLPTSYIGKLFYFFAKVVIHKADAVLCVSESVKSNLPKSKKVKVLFDGFIPKNINIEQIHDKRKELNVLYLSNFIKGKGQDIAIKAFNEAYKKNKNLVLNFVGGDLGMDKNKKFKDNLIMQTNEYMLGKAVNFFEYTHDVERIIKDSDIVLMLSESESFSMVCLEALWHGTPLIASDCGGPRELFENGKSGILVPNKDYFAASRALVDLSLNLSLRNQFSIEGRKIVKEKFDIIKSSSKLKSVYLQE